MRHVQMSTGGCGSTVIAGKDGSEVGPGGGRSAMQLSVRVKDTKPTFRTAKAVVGSPQ